MVEYCLQMLFAFNACTFSRQNVALKREMFQAYTCSFSPEPKAALERGRHMFKCKKDR